MTELVVGIKHTRDDIVAQTAIGAEMSVIGLIGTAPDADVAAFPLNTNVLVRTDDSTLRLKLGATGTLEQAMKGISAQLGTDQGAALVVVRRVEAGVDAFATIANIIGSESSRTGMWGFLDSGEEIGYIPRLIIAPGFTSQTKAGVKTIAVTNGGSGYTTAPAVAFSGGAGSGATATATVSGGAVTAVTITASGEGYTSAPTISFSGGGGTSAAATATIGMNANGVCANMPTILNRLRGHGITTGPTTSRTDYINWLETIPGSVRMHHPIAQAVKVIDATGATITVDVAPYAAGLYVRCDAENNGVPSKSIGNQTINGIVGVTPIIPFSYIDASSAAQDYLGRSGGVIARGESGVEAAVANNGFVFWGIDNLGDDSAYQFSNVARMRDYIELTQVKVLRRFLGQYNITVQTVQAIINTMDAHLRVLKADGHILDYRVVFEPDRNTPTELRAGKLDISFHAEEPPPLRLIDIRSRKYTPALVDLVQRISVQLNTNVAA